MYLISFKAQDLTRNYKEIQTASIGERSTQNIDEYHLVINGVPTNASYSLEFVVRNLLAVLSPLDVLRCWQHLSEEQKETMGRLNIEKLSKEPGFKHIGIHYGDVSVYYGDVKTGVTIKRKMAVTIGSDQFYFPLLSHQDALKYFREHLAKESLDAFEHAAQTGNTTQFTVKRTPS